VATPACGCWTRSRASATCSGSRSRQRSATSRASARRASWIGYAGLAPKINQSGDRSRTGALSKAGSRTLRWAAVEAAQHAWRPSNPWHQLYTDLAARAGKNPAKSAVARKILIAAWHVLSRNEAFKPAAPRRPSPVSASSRCLLAA
jgi:transposase